ncbi:MAG: PCRF domain-containing protein [Patescibacteria group bacterium]|nr:PCRF domain-containing protein [Patescibacteria group bacterium]MDE1945611.1 PCRF domain-containing protein [Patescibacteria group bacterium]
MDELKEKLAKLEAELAKPDFWADKAKAQTTLKEINFLKGEILGKDKYDAGHAIMNIFSGAGGDDAEDFSRILLEMYEKYAAKQGWDFHIIDAAENDHGGYRNVIVEIIGPNAYGLLKNESGVHRLVRLSPFNAKNLRQTSFSMVEVVPKIDKDAALDIPESELKIEISKAGGPGGQNVNKRETAVRIVHIPTGIAVRSTSERSQPQNKEKALQILKGKLFKLHEAEKAAEQAGRHISKSVSIDWGNQIRSYVFHPYKMIKDHRTDMETANIEPVLAGDLGKFIEAEKNL